MDVERPPDVGATSRKTPNRTRAERFGGPILEEGAEFISSGFFVKRCVLRTSAEKVATVRGNDVRFRDGSMLSFEVFKAGIRPRHGRTVLVDGSGAVKASAEWVASDHYFQVHGDDCSYTVDRGDRRHLWQIHGDGVVATFDQGSVDVSESVPAIALLLAWRIASMLERMHGSSKPVPRAWDRSNKILGS